MEKNNGLTPYTEEEKQKIQERIQADDGHQYGIYVSVLVVINGIIGFVAESISYGSFWLFPILLIRLAFAIAGFVYFWRWIADLIRRARKAKK